MEYGKRLALEIRVKTAIRCSYDVSLAEGGTTYLQKSAD
jgi:hypothetical protein